MSVAFVGSITEIKIIQNADRIVLAEVSCGDGGTWNGVVGIGQFNVGDKVNVFLQDALIPQTLIDSDLQFLKSPKIKMSRLRGVPSECLITKVFQGGDVGEAIDDKLGVIKYEKKLPVELMGMAEGNFPSNLLPKTDEVNFQAVPEMVELLKTIPCYSTIKMDGTSATYIKHEGKFYVCSRNLELKDGENVYWRMAREYDIENKLPEGIAIQAEIYGEGIQGNPLGITGQAIAVFNVYDIANHAYFGRKDFDILCKQYEFPAVSLVCYYEHGLTQTTSEELRATAERVKYQNGANAEGLVFRPMEETYIGNKRVSFKVLSLSYKEAANDPILETMRMMVSDDE